MPRLSKNTYCQAPNGELISPSLYARIMAAKPILEQANAERITRSDAASRILIGGIPVTEVTAYNYVRLLNLSWHHQQPYRARVDRAKLVKLVPKLLKKGLEINQIAEQVGCSKDTVGRFIREAQLVPDGQRYVAPATLARRKAKRVK